LLLSCYPIDLNPADVILFDYFDRASSSYIFSNCCA